MTKNSLKTVANDFLDVFNKYGINGLLTYISDDENINIDFTRRVALMNTSNPLVFFYLNEHKKMAEPHSKGVLIKELEKDMKVNILANRFKYIFGGILLLIVFYQIYEQWRPYQLKTNGTNTSEDIKNKISPKALQQIYNDERKGKYKLKDNETWSRDVAESNDNFLHFGYKTHQTWGDIGKDIFSSAIVNSISCLIQSLLGYKECSTMNMRGTHTTTTPTKGVLGSRQNYAYDVAKFIIPTIIGLAFFSILGKRYFKKNHDKSQLIHVKNEINESPKDEMDYNNNFEDNMILHKALLKSKSLGELRYQLLQLNNKKLLDLDVHFFVRKDGTLRNSFDEIARAIEHYPTSRWNKTMKWFNMYTPKKKLRIKQSKKRSRSRRRSRSHKK